MTTASAVPAAATAAAAPPRIVVFLGPTLPRRAAAERLQADYRPPAGQGDVLRAVLDGADAVVLIDGFFEEVPAVWHKEILYALSRGVAVIGAASMGALRGAELHAFGMIGVGAIFDAYRTGRWNDDDEVAVSHGPAELGYPAVSEAMANIRATLGRAAAENVVSPETAEKLTAAVKALPYRSRNFDAALNACGDDAARAALAAWLPTGRVDQKRLDALSALDAAAAWRDAGAPRREATFHFEHTTLFERALREAMRTDAADSP